MRNLSSKKPMVSREFSFPVIFRIAAALYMGDQVVDLPGTFNQISYNTLALRVLHGFGFTFGETWWRRPFTVNWLPAPANPSASNGKYPVNLPSGGSVIVYLAATPGLLSVNGLPQVIATQQ